MIHRSVVIGLSCLCFGLPAAIAAAAGPAPVDPAAPLEPGSAQVVFTDIAGHASASVPGHTGLAFAGGVIGRPAASPDGRRWIVVTSVTGKDSQVREVILVGDGLDAAVVARTGDAAPGSGGGVFAAFSPEVRVTDAGEFGFTATVAAGGVVTEQQFRVQTVPGRRAVVSRVALPAPSDVLLDVETIEPDAEVETVAFTPSAVVVSPAGDWLIRGADANGTEWVFRNGEPVAAAGDPVTLLPDENVHFQAADGEPAFFSMQANASGDIVVGGRTGDGAAGSIAAIILNSQRVILREGDRVDLDGDGHANDDAFLSGFSTDGAFLSDRGWYYFTAEIATASGRVLGRGLLRVGICKPDWDASGAPTSSDIAAFVAAWLVSVDEGSPLADYDRDGAATSSDLASFLSDWLSAVGDGC